MGSARGTNRKFSVHGGVRVVLGVVKDTARPQSTFWRVNSTFLGITHLSGVTVSANACNYINNIIEYFGLKWF